VELTTAREHARMLTGSYFSSRGSFTNFVDVSNLVGQAEVGLDREGRPLVPELFGGPPRTWIEIAPFLWQDALGHARLGAVVEKGKVVRWSVNEIAPFMVYDRAPWHRDARWLLPAFIAAIVVILLAAVAWPIGVATRRYWSSRGAVLTRQGNHPGFDRVVAVFAGLVVLVTCGWVALLVFLGETMSAVDWPIWLLQIVGTIVYCGLLATALGKLALTWKDGRGWLGRAWGILLVCSAAVVLWVAISFHLISFGSKY
jgi:hypothetical protein